MSRDMLVKEQRPKVAMQINMHPFDVRQIRHVLPHQIKVWGDQLDHIIITVDTHLSKGGRYSGGDFDDKLAAMRALYPTIECYHPHLEIHEVDYSLDAMKQAAQYFFGLDELPIKAMNGGPFYCYFYGLMCARQAQADYILHMDCDMLFGGFSPSWIKDAIAAMERHHDAVFAEPLPGPPHPDGALFGHRYIRQNPVNVADTPESPAFQFTTVSMRIYLMHVKRFEERMQPLTLYKPNLNQAVRGCLLGNDVRADCIEDIWHKNMVKKNTFRIAMLGADGLDNPGMWSLHPLYHSADYHDALPDIIARIEAGDIPDSQRGDYNLSDAYYDWTSERKNRAFIPRMTIRAKDMMRHLFGSHE